VPKQEYFSNALYTIDIGQNDLADGIFGGLTVQQLNDSVPQIIDSFSTNVRVGSNSILFFLSFVNHIIY